MTKLTVEVLGESRLLDILSRATDGAMADTFICNVNWDDGVVRKSFVKRYVTSNQLALVNEITGYIIANGCSLSIPGKVGIINLSDNLFSTQLNQDPNQKYHEWCIVVSAVNGKTPNSYYPDQMSKCKALINILAGWELLADAISFDDWVANQDRNLGNFVIESKNKIYLIDHSNLPVSLNWEPSQLVATQEYENQLINILNYFTHMPLPIKSSICSATSKHASIYNNVIDDLEYWWNVFFESTNKGVLQKQSLGTFLKQRANLGKTRVAKQYQLLVV
ncbi:hypothetical protein [Pseudoalteromonas sp. BSi20495]|uniref:hypothetical protein n=1 Tax=Pseudoalteromonas sp. BSi20495 TaxID=386429 RepID=UPI0002316426|nr:hypothetical protein [Pseudoalteromonas sp. BSi20495]GAA78513.1 hypothetical protein P20495_1004 [Pseudoalteromonas sp. BSi20495]